MFDKLQSRLEVTGWLKVETALHIGTGRTTEVGGSDLPVVRDAFGRPYIPGSSFKGVLRARLESLVRAVSDQDKAACNPTETEEWCITRDDLKDFKEKIRSHHPRERDQELTEFIIKQSCLICLSFGSPWLASKVLVRDLHVDESLWFGQFQVRDGVAIDRDTETAAEGKLYDYEVVPPGTRFNLHLLVENGEPWQWGMVLLGLKAFENGSIPIGGHKSRGLGWVKFDWERRRLFSLNEACGKHPVDRIVDFLNGEGFQDVSETKIQQWVNEFKQRLLEKKVGD